MPHCSPCGYAVDILRSCYESTWILCKDTGRRIRGRYVFAPEGTPFFPYLHHYGSRNWTTSERKLGNRTILGEVDGEPRPYSRGEPPANFPLARVIGEPTCFLEGTDCKPLRPFQKVIGCATGQATVYAVFFDATGDYKTLNGRETAMPFHLPLPDSSWATVLPFPIDPILGDYAGFLYCGGTGMRFSLVLGFWGAIPIERGTIDANNGELTKELTYRFEGAGIPGNGGFSVGITLVPPTPPPATISGFPIGCYDVQTPFPIAARSTLFNFAETLRLSYVDIDQCGVFIESYFEGSAQVRTPNSGAIVPGNVICQRADQTLVAISGTSNDTQLVAQFASALFGINEAGGFWTSDVWFNVATSILNDMSAAGVSATLPITIIGHSYGGAVATIIAQRIKQGNPGTIVQLVTFGCPKVGDTRLSALLADVNRIHVANAGDAVCDVPPSIPDIAGLGLSPALPFFLRWLLASALGKRFRVEVDGTIVESDSEVWSLSALIDIAEEILAGDPLTFPSAHLASEYAARLALLE